jgi:hypothetical protein
MNENLGKIKDTLKQIVEQEFLPNLFSRVDSHEQFFSELSEMIGEYSNLIEKLNYENEYNSIEDIIELYKRILEKLESRFYLEAGESLLSDLESFDKKINSFISETEETRIETQTKERFYFQQDENLYFRILKFLKRILFNLSVISARIKNGFLKLFKKPTEEFANWNHLIPLRNLRSIYLKSPLYFEHSELYKKTFSVQSNSLLSLKNYTEQAENIFREKHLHLNESKNELPNYKISKFTYSDIIKSFDNVKDEFKKRSDEIIDKIITDYSDAYLKAGTIELTSRKLSSQKVNESEKEFEKLYKNIHKRWNNTLFALADDWRMDYELYLTRYKLIGEYIKTTSVVSEKINKNVKPSINSINNAISDVKDRFGTLKQSSSEIKDYITKSRHNLKTTLTEKLIPFTSDALLKQDILYNIDELEDTVEKSISELSDKRALVKTDAYDDEIKDSEISFVSLQEMLSYSCLPEFKSRVLKTKAEQSLKIQKVLNDLLEIDQIFDFSLDSAQIMLKEKKGDATEAKQVVIDGFDRAIKKIDDINDQLLNLNNSFAQNIKEPLDQLNEDLIKLTFTESAFELKLEIAKDRALQKSRELRKETIQKFQNTLPHIFSLVKEGYYRFTKLYSTTRKLIGFEKTVATIKLEVSNFLSETVEAINKLPFVYQRLFTVEPIGDERLFFGRDEELVNLSIAYDNWSAGKFSPTIIVGEKGSGATSLINVFIKKKRFKNKTIRISIKESVQSKEDFVNLISGELARIETGELQDLIKSVNNKNSEKKIVVLENLQHLFLRKVNGFENLKLLFELISETNENVFWITTCTIYGYRYLQKTISITDYFANEVELGELDYNQIIDIILKRHRVSGYDIYFEEPESFHSNKNFQKLSDEEKQAQLEKNYFSMLNKFADSNISLALLFWVRSTTAISSDKITIGQLPKIDFSFLSALPNEKFFVINLLLIHDGLTEEDVSSINGISVERNRRLLIALEDDGIIVRNSKLFLINPLLYRPIVEVLRAKNIIN